MFLKLGNTYFAMSEIEIIQMSEDKKNCCIFFRSGRKSDPMELTKADIDLIESYRADIRYPCLSGCFTSLEESISEDESKEGE